MAFKYFYLKIKMNLYHLIPLYITGAPKKTTK